MPAKTRYLPHQNHQNHRYLDGALKDILFLDIETIRCAADYGQLDERLKTHWARKAQFLKKGMEEEDGALFMRKAGLYAEFGRVVAIAMGYFAEEDEGQVSLRVKSLADHEEGALLGAFTALLEKFDQENVRLCAHNGKEFDFPYLSRRLLANGIGLPGALQLGGKKPWEVNHLDTMDMWRFGEWRHYTPLDLLARLVGVPASTAALDGSLVSETYYQEDGLERIAASCAADVVVTAQVYLKMKGLPVVSPDDVYVV